MDGSAHGLEQFVLLAKDAKGKAGAALIERATRNPNTFVFGELLDAPSIKELEHGDHGSYYQLLRLFAYGTYSEYRANKVFIFVVENQFGQYLSM